jgi:hypothetical protein
VIFEQIWLCTGKYLDSDPQSSEKQDPDLHFSELLLYKKKRDSGLPDKRPSANAAPMASPSARL